MNKKDYQLFAETIAKIDNENERVKLINWLSDIFERDNERYDKEKFCEFIKRRRNNESLKGLRVNKKYLYD